MPLVVLLGYLRVLVVKSVTQVSRSTLSDSWQDLVNLLILLIGSDGLIQKALWQHNLGRLRLLPLMTVTPHRSVVALVLWAVISYFHTLGRDGSDVVAVVLRFASVEGHWLLYIDVLDVSNAWSVVLIQGLVTVGHITLVELTILFLGRHVVELAPIHVEA